MKYQFIKDNHSGFSVERMAKVLNVSRSGFYVWGKRPRSNREIENARLDVEIKAIYEASKHRYGSVKITRELEKRGKKYGRNRVANRMRKMDIASKVRRKFKATTNSKLLEIQKVLLDEFMGFTYVCNKKYLLTLFFLDTCVEPFFYKRGLDFYKDGQNYALASLMYYTAPTFWGKDEFERILYYFQRASKTKLDVNVQILIEKAKITPRKGIIRKPYSSYR